MPLDTLKTLSIQHSQKQEKEIDHLTEEAPILADIPFDQSTHGLSHLAETVTDIDAMGFVDMDAPLPEVGSHTKLVRFELAQMGGIMYVTEDKAKQMGGAAAYFNTHEPRVLKATGQSTEVTILYDNLRQFAIDQGKAVSAGGSANANYSIIAVRWEEGVCSGIYDAGGFGDGRMFDVMPLNNGALHKINAAGQVGYGARLKSNIGMLLHGDRNVSAIVNIDIVNGNLPTAAQIDDMLSDVRATGSGRTMLLMHERVQKALGRQFKDGKIQMRPADTVIDHSVDGWDSVPMLGSYNFKDAAEQNVTL